MSTPSPLAIRGIDAAAKVLGLGRRTTWSLARCDAIPHLKVGSGYLFLPAQLERWLSEGAPTEPGSGSRIQKSMRREAQR